MTLNNQYITYYFLTKQEHTLRLKILSMMRLQTGDKKVEEIIDMRTSSLHQIKSNFSPSSENCVKPHQLRNIFVKRHFGY